MDTAVGRIDDSSAGSRSRFGVLDGLRFVAALSVLVFHFTARQHDSWGVATHEAFPVLHRLTAYGAFGVDLFFVISGFVILLSSWGRSVPQFVASRVSRLYPAYWVGVLATGLLLLVLWPDRKAVTAPQIGINLTMLQGAFGVENVDGVYWTLWAELRFYLLMAVFVAVGITMSRVLVFAILWPVVAALAHTGGFDFLAEVLIYEYAPLFAGGMALYCITRSPRSLVAWLVFAGNVLFSAAWTAKFTGRIVTDTTVISAGVNKSAALTLLCFVLVALAVLTPLRLIKWRWLTVLGALTYPLYLLHEYWGWWVIHIIHEALPVPLTFAVATAACISAAWLVYRYVEKPFGPWLRRALETSLAGRSATVRTK